jgi:hypothetical protein
MILRRIEAYVGRAAPCTRQQIARHFDMTEDALEPMLKMLEQKGRIRPLSRSCPGAGHLSCAGCPAANAAAVMYVAEDERACGNGHGK